MIEVSLERERGRWVYEFKVIEAGGRLREVYVDAATAEDDVRIARKVKSVLEEAGYVVELVADGEAA